MSSPPQVAVFEQLGPTPPADLNEKKQASDAVAAPLDEEESSAREGEQKSRRTTSIFAVAGCVSSYWPLSNGIPKKPPNKTNSFLSLRPQPISQMAINSTSHPR